MGTGEWIKCEEQMPEFGMKVMAWHPKLERPMFVETYPCDERLVWDDSYAIHSINSFSHWMPLPEPPK